MNMQVLHTTSTYDPVRDIDWIAVERAANDTYNPAMLNEAERIEAGLLMARHGYSEREIGERLDVWRRTVSRWKETAGITRQQLHPAA